jgi:hypothetical protein
LPLHESGRGAAEREFREAEALAQKPLIGSWMASSSTRLRNNFQKFELDRQAIMDSVACTALPVEIPRSPADGVVPAI